MCINLRVNKKKSSHEVGGRRIAGGERDVKHRTLPPVDIIIIRALNGRCNDRFNMKRNVIQCNFQRPFRAQSVFYTIPGVTFDASHLSHPRLSFFRHFVAHFQLKIFHLLGSSLTPAILLPPLCGSVYFLLSLCLMRMEYPKF